MRRTIRYAVFPTVFGGALLAAWWGLSAGFHASVVVFGVSVSAALLVTLLERLLPFEPEWSRSHGDVPTDLFYVVSSLIAAPRLFDTIALAALIPLASAIPWGQMVKQTTSVSATWRSSRSIEGIRRVGPNASHSGNSATFVRRAKGELKSTLVNP